MHLLIGGLAIIFAIMIFWLPLVFGYGLISQPFNWVESVANRYPLQTARIVIGFGVSLAIATLMEVPYETQLVWGFGAGASFISWLLGEIL